MVFPNNIGYNYFYRVNKIFSYDSEVMQSFAIKGILFSHFTIVYLTEGNKWLDNHSGRQPLFENILSYRITKKYKSTFCFLLYIAEDFHLRTKTQLLFPQSLHIN